MSTEQYRPMHPGAFIKRVYVVPNNICVNELARRLKVSPSLISRLLNKKAGVSAKMALKLSKVLGRSPESWMLMQDYYDLWQARAVVDLEQFETIKFV